MPITPGKKAAHMKGAARAALPAKRGACRQAARPWPKTPSRW